MSDTTTTREEGVRLLQAGDVTGALNHLRQAVSQNPTDGKAYGYLGVCYARLGDYSLAVTALQHAVRLLPNDASMRFNLGMTLFQAQRYAEAKPELELALSLNPNHNGARDLLGRVATLDAAATASPVVPSAIPGLGQPHSQPMGTAAPVPPPPLSTSGAPGWNPAPLHSPAGASAPPMPSWTSPATGATTPPPMPSWSAAPSPNAAPPGNPSQPGMPAPLAGMPPGNGTAAQSPVAAGGLQYTAVEGGMTEGREPGIGRRLLRGWLWGIVYGQWWTLWTIISTFLWRGGKFEIVETLVAAFLYGFFGSLAGIVIAATNAREGTAAGIGVAAGFLMMGLEALFGGAMAFINIIWYFFTGRYVGAGLAGRIHAPIVE